MSNANVQITMSLKDEISANLSAIQQQFSAFDKVGSVLQGIGTQMMGIGGMAVKTFADFEQQMKNVQVVAGASQEEFEKLSEKARDIGSSTVFSASQAAEALYSLSSAGLSANDQISALDGVVSLAAATQSELAQASETVVATISQFGLGFENASKVSDIFTAAIGNSMATLDSLQYSMKYVGPVAAGLNLTLEETTGALMALYQGGLKGEQAGTTLRSALTKLVTPAESTKKAFAELGISFDEIKNSSNPLVAAIELLGASGADTSQIMQIFGESAGPGMVALISQGSEKIKEYTETLENSTGAAQKAAEEQTKTLAGAFKEIQSALEDAAIGIGESLAPMVSKIADGIKGMIAAWTSLDPSLQNAIVQFGAVSGVILLVGGGLTAIVGTIAKSISVWAQFGGAMMSAFQAIPGMVQSFGTLANNIMAAANSGSLLTGFLTTGLPLVALAALAAAIAYIANEITKLNAEAKKIQTEFNEQVNGAIQVTDQWYHKIPLIGDAIKNTEFAKEMKVWFDASGETLEQIKNLHLASIELGRDSSLSVEESVQAYGNLKGSLEETVQKIEKAGGMQEAFGTASAGTTKQLAALIVELERNGVEVDGLKNRLGTLNPEFNSVYEGMKKVSASSSEMAVEVGASVDNIVDATMEMQKQINSINFEILTETAKATGDTITKAFEAMSNEAAASLGVIDNFQFSNIGKTIQSTSKNILGILTDLGIDGSQAMKAIDEVDWSSLKLSTEEARKMLIEEFEKAGFSSEKAIQEVNKINFDELRANSNGVGEEIKDAFAQAKENALAELDQINEKKFDALKNNMALAVSEGVDAAKAKLMELKALMEELNNQKVEIKTAVK